MTTIWFKAIFICMWNKRNISGHFQEQISPFEKISLHKSFKNFTYILDLNNLKWMLWNYIFPSTDMLILFLKQIKYNEIIIVWITLFGYYRDRIIYRMNNILNNLNCLICIFYSFYMRQIILLLIICLPFVHLLLPNLSLKKLTCAKNYLRR